MLLMVGSGCTGTKLWKDDPAKVPAGIPTTAMSPSLMPEHNPVVQASATVPATTTTSSGSNLLTKLGGKQPKVPVTEMAIFWRNWVDYLPDPANKGAAGPGLAGQLLLYGPSLQFAPPGGKLTIALYY